MANRFASLLAEHVTDHWELVAEIDRPGVAAKIAAVRAGDEPTTVLPADIAVRVIGELDDPASAAATDTRTTVQAALGAVAATTPAARPTRPGRAAKLFDGAAEEICQRIDGRRSALTYAHITAWLTLPDGTRDSTAASVLAATTTSGAAAVIADFAARHGAAATKYVAAAHRHAGRSESPASVTDRGKRQRAIRDGIAAALAGWLRDHSGGLPWGTRAAHHDTDAPTAPPHPVAEAAGEGLAVLAGRTATYFAGPEHLAELALSQPHRKPPHAAGRRNLLMCGADSGLGWATIRGHLHGDDPLTAADLVKTVNHLGGTPAGRRVAVEAIRAEIWTMDPHAVASSAGGTELLDRYARELTCAEKLRFAAVTCYAEETSWASWAYTVLHYLTGAHAPTREEIAAAAAADPGTDSYLGRVADALEISAIRYLPDHDNLDELWDRFVPRRAVRHLCVSAAGHRRCAAAWARHCQTLIGDAGGDPAALWAAAAALAEGFDGTTAELVEVAAATTAP